MKKFLSVLAGAVLLFGFASFAFAAPFDFPITYTDFTGAATTTQTLTPPSSSGSLTLPVFVGNGDASSYQEFSLGSGIATAGNTLSVTPFSIETTDGHLSDTLGLLNSAVTTASANAANAQSNIATIGANVSPYLTFAVLELSKNIFGTSTSLTCTSASTTTCLMTKAQGVKLDAMSANLPWSFATSSRSIVTGTGATGFLVSSTRNSTDKYNVTVTTTASIAGNATGYIALEMASTNSATASDWIEVARCGNSQALSLAITLQSIQGTTCELLADVPAGYYTKLRSVTTTGTVTFAYVSGQEVLK